MALQSIVRPRGESGCPEHILRPRLPHGACEREIREGRQLLGGLQARLSAGPQVDRGVWEECTAISTGVWFGDCYGGCRVCRRNLFLSAPGCVQAAFRLLGVADVEIA